MALLAAAWRAIRELTGMYLEDHAAAEGRQVQPTLAQWNTEQVLTSMRVTGPVAFKKAITDGKDERQALASMATQMAGAAEKTVLRADRDTVMATAEASGEIVGWRRVSDGDPCAWCAMLLSRGAVYKSGRTAGDSRFGGSEYHDHDRCTAEPLYEHEDEPPEVAALYQLWLKVTAGKSGADALRAWRENWDSLHRDIAAQQRIAPAAREPEREPKPPEQPARTAAASRFYRSLNGLEDLAEIAGAARDAERVKLYGGQSAKVQLVTLPDGRRAVSKRAEDWGDTSPETVEELRHAADAEQLVYLLGRAIDAPVARVYRDADDHVWVEFIEGSPDDVTDAMLDGREGILLGLLDALSAGIDRNGGNMIGRGGKFLGIDHAESWREHLMDPDQPRVGSSDSPQARHFATEEAAWKDNPLTPSDINVVRDRAEALREDFALVGHEDWLDYALNVLDRLAVHAKGTRPLYG